MKILIGSPVYQRAWILEHWFKSIENQSIPLSEIGFLFELGPNDQETHDLIWGWQSRHPEVAYFDAFVREDLTHSTHEENHRTWTKDAYFKMVELRNSLLERASHIGPDKYFSLDSDLIMEDPQTLEKLYHISERDGVDAVSPLSYMFPNGIDFPSVMTWADHPGGRAARQLDSYPIGSGSTFKADIIMAAVMMNPDVYSNVKYEWHAQGEDLGWSTQCHAYGKNLYCASGTYVTHIMHRWMLENYLNNRDPRKHQAYSLI
jgi:hypothetical protein